MGRYRGGRRIAEAALIRQVAESLARAGTVDEGLLRILPLLSRFVGADRGFFRVGPESDPRLLSFGDAPGSGFLLPPVPDLFRRSAPARISADLSRIEPLGEGAAEVPDGFGVPVRLSRRFLGYGIFPGRDLIVPTRDTLLLLDAVGAQVGAFCGNIALREEVAVERDRLARANEELDFLLHLNGALSAVPDLDGLFKWLCREIGRFVPSRGIELATVAAGPAVRTCGVPLVKEGGRKDRDGYQAAWADRLASRCGVRVSPDEIRIKTFPFLCHGAREDRRTAGRGPLRTWESPLLCGNAPAGLLAVRLEASAAAGGREERVLAAVTGQLGLFIRNLSEREKVLDLATHDGLTGLLNYLSFKAIFEREFERFLRHGRNLSLLMIDLDRFKQVNDTFGHRAGDAVLTRVAGIIRSALRRTDYAFRYGGDEFVVLMAETDAAKAAIIGQRICAAVKERTRGIPPFESPLSVSIGVADCAAVGAGEREELLLRADEALYRAKNAGRDRLHVAEPARPDSPRAANVPGPAGVTAAGLADGPRPLDAETAS